MGKLMKRIVFNIERCMGCRSCELACSVAHTKAKELIRAILAGEKSRSRVAVLKAEEFAVPMQCRHCENAPCIAVCPTEALRRDGPEDSVQFDSERCTGCGKCVVVCPFGAIVEVDEGRLIEKCDLCIDRLKDGQEPACIIACPTCTLEFKEVEKVAADTRKKLPAKFLKSLRRRKRSDDLQSSGGNRS